MQVVCLWGVKAEHGERLAEMDPRWELDGRIG